MGGGCNTIHAYIRACSAAPCQFCKFYHRGNMVPAYLICTHQSCIETHLWSRTIGNVPKIRHIVNRLEGWNVTQFTPIYKGMLSSSLPVLQILSQGLTSAREPCVGWSLQPVELTREHSRWTLTLNHKIRRSMVGRNNIYVLSIWSCNVFIVFAAVKMHVCIEAKSNLVQFTIWSFTRFNIKVIKTHLAQILRAVPYKSKPTTCHI